MLVADNVHDPDLLGVLRYKVVTFRWNPQPLTFSRKEQHHGVNGRVVVAEGVTSDLFALISFVVAVYLAVALRRS